MSTSTLTQARLGWVTGLGDDLRQAHLNPQQEQALAIVAKKSPAGSSDVASALVITSAHAGNLLAALVAKGYLLRSDTGDPTGGTLYEYSIHPDLAVPLVTREEALAACRDPSGWKGPLPDPGSWPLSVWPFGNGRAA